jgi:hypothetical protein
LASGTALAGLLGSVGIGSILLGLGAAGVTLAGLLAAVKLSQIIIDDIDISDILGSGGGRSGETVSNDADSIGREGRATTSGPTVGTGANCEG